MTGKSLYVVCSSPQENPLTEGNLKELLDDVAEREGCEAVIMAIQPNRPNVRLPIDRILQDAVSRGFEISVFVINPARNGDVCDYDSIRRRVLRAVPSSDVTELPDGRRRPMNWQRSTHQRSHADRDRGRRYDGELVLMVDVLADRRVAAALRPPSGAGNSPDSMAAVQALLTSAHGGGSCPCARAHGIRADARSSAAFAARLFVIGSDKTWETSEVFLAFGSIVRAVNAWSRPSGATQARTRD